MQKLELALTGSGGFIGKYISKKFITDYNLSYIKLKNRKDVIEFIEQIKKNKFDLIINCAASLNPKSKWDFYINIKLPKIIVYSLQKYKLKANLYHLSSINVLNTKLNDNYTLSKKKAEKNLVNTKAIIIRPNMILSDNNDGQTKIFHNYLSYKLPVYLMIKNGNFYKPIYLSDFIKILEKIINEQDKKIIYNIEGSEVKSIWEIFLEINKVYKRKVLPININKFGFLIPTFVKKIMNKNKYFQHINENKIFM